MKSQIESSSSSNLQPNSMDSSDSGVTSVGSTTTNCAEYAYRPLTTKHRRAGSTGTTGDEEYTSSDEDELDEADCCHHLGGNSLNTNSTHPMILKDDLARAATDLFGYGSTNVKKDHHAGDMDEPTSLFDDDDVVGFCRERYKLFLHFLFSINIYSFQHKIKTRI